MAAKRRVVPLKRTLKRGDVGPDVIGLKRALGKAKVYKPPSGKNTTQFGDACKAGVKRFQVRAGLPSDGEYGPRTHKKLLPFYDNYGAYLMGHGPAQANVLSSTARSRVVNEATWGYNNRSQIHYAQIRPMPSLNAGHSLPQTHDCSGFATACYKRAGAPDPNAFGYNGLGYTGTLSQHGHSVSLSAVRPGDLVFYGSGFPYTHVAVYVGFGRVVSHGSEEGPYLLPVDYRTDRRVIRSYLP